MEKEHKYRRNVSTLVTVPDKTITNANKLHVFLYELDCHLEDLAQRLEQAQPRHAGRLVVIWEPDTGKPRMARWERRGKTHWRLLGVPRANLVRRACSKGAFAKNYEDVKTLLGEISRALETRTKILTAYANFNRAAIHLMERPRAWTTAAGLGKS